MSEGCLVSWTTPTEDSVRSRTLKAQRKHFCAPKVRNVFTRTHPYPSISAGAGHCECDPVVLVEPEPEAPVRTSRDLAVDHLGLPARRTVPRTHWQPRASVLPVSCLDEMLLAVSQVFISAEKCCCRMCRPLQNMTGDAREMPEAVRGDNN